MTEMCTRHPIHVIIDRQVCETDQMADFHIVGTLTVNDELNFATLNFGAFNVAIF